MPVLLPIIPASEADAALLRTPLPGKPFPGKPLFACLPRRLAAAGIDCLVCTTLPDAARLLKDAGVAVELMPERPFLPYRRGLRLALEFLVHKGRLAPNAPLAAVDCRFVFLRPETAADCLAHAGEPGPALASFAPARPHPVQLFRPCRVVEADVFVFPEAADEAAAVLAPFGLAGGCGVTAPFFFDWRGLGWRGEAPGPVALTVSRNGSPALFAPEADTSAALAAALTAGRRILLRTAPFRARRLLPAGTPGDAAVSAMLSVARPRLCICRTAGGDVVSETAAGRATAEGARRFCLWPLENGVPGALLRRMLPAGAPLRLPAGEAAAPAGYFAALQDQPASGLVHYEERLDGGPLWSVGPATNRPSDPATGRTFCNRQQYPPLLVLDGAVFAGTAAGLLGRRPGDAWRPLRLPQPEAKGLHAPLDLLEAAESTAPAEGSAPPVRPTRPRPVSPADAVSGLVPPDAGDVAALSERILACWNLLRLLHNPAPEGVASAGRPSRGLSPQGATPAEVVVANFCAAGVTLRNRLLAAQIPAHPASAAPEPEPPFPAPAAPRRVTADGAAALFCVGRSAGSPAALFLLRPGGAVLQEIGRPGAAYGGIWFDPERRRLFAFRCAAGGKNPGLDVFDSAGRLLLKAPLPPGLCPAAPECAFLCGGSGRLFLGASGSGRIAELDAETFAPRRVWDPPVGMAWSGLACAAGGLWLALLGESQLVRLPLTGGGRPEFHEGPELIFPVRVACTPDGGRLAVACLDRPQADRPPACRLNVFDRSLHLLSSRPLGRIDLRDLTVRDVAPRRIVLADAAAGLRSRPLD